jgi:hypothetical protein
MNDQPQLTEEFSAGAARLRVDVHGGEPREHVLDDLTFLNYRLADVRISPRSPCPTPTSCGTGSRQARPTTACRDVHGDCRPADPEVIVAVRALHGGRGLHPSHSAAVHYRGRTLLFPAASPTTARAWA